MPMGGNNGGLEKVLFDSKITLTPLSERVMQLIDDGFSNYQMIKPKEYDIRSGKDISGRFTVKAKGLFGSTVLEVGYSNLGASNVSPWYVQAKEKDRFVVALTDLVKQYNP
jgi:hypothetical protein